MAKYINPYTDFGFKKLFGEEGNKSLLIDFLNQLLPKHHQIKDLSFRSLENLPDTTEERKAFFDIHCEAESGERFIVEMQKAKVKHFKDRALFYTTFPIREQAQKGEWNFELSAIYFVAVLDFFYDENEERAKFYRDVKLKDQDCETFYEKLHFKFLQMPAFTKTAKELKTKFDKWAYFLKNLESFEDIPHILNEDVFKRAFGTAEVANFTPEQRAEYEQSRMNYLGVKAVSDTAKEEKEIEMVLKPYFRGKSAEEISDFLDISLSRVIQIIKEYGKK
jgi:predicted transposase/invertase (TIGR01784 family)